MIRCRDTPYDFRAGLSEDGAEGSKLIGARISETPEGIGYDTVYVLDDPPIDTNVAAQNSEPTSSVKAPGGSADLLSTPAAATLSLASAAEEHGLEPEPEVESQPDVRRLGSFIVRPAARLVDEVSGRVMEVVTNQPCLICYSANHLQPTKGSAPTGSGNEQDGKKRGKRGRRRQRRQSGRDTNDNDGGGTARKSNSAGGPGDESELYGDTEVDTLVDSPARHRQWGAICLETVNYIGSLRFKQLPSMVLHPGQEYYHKTVHSFSTTGPPQKPDGESSAQDEQQNDQSEELTTGAASSENTDAAQVKDCDGLHEGETGCPNTEPRHEVMGHRRRAKL